jgi:hypothetical protein
VTAAINRVAQGSGGTRDWSHLKPYYQVAFAAIDDAGGAMTPRWNWAAFLFGWVWYFFRGMFLKGLLLLIVSVATAGFGWVVLCIYTGLYGTYDFYLLTAKGKQLW